MPAIIFPPAPRVPLTDQNNDIALQWRRYFDQLTRAIESVSSTVSEPSNVDDVEVAAAMEINDYQRQIFELNRRIDDLEAQLALVME